MERFKTSLIISTYNWPEALDLCLQSSLHQVIPPDEILIADDGSDERTAKLVAQYADTAPIPIIHVWHEDNGFRLGSIRNKAIARASGDYIIQIDGDVILPPRFIQDHLSVAHPRRFVSGSRVLLGAEYSAQPPSPFIATADARKIILPPTPCFTIAAPHARATYIAP